MTQENDKDLFRLSGKLMLVAVSTSLLSGILAGIYGVELNAFDVGTTLTNVGQNSVPHAIGLVIENISAIFTIALAGVLFFAFKPFNKVKALIGSLWLITGAIILAVHDLGNFSLVWVASDWASAEGPQKQAIEAVARSMLLTGKWGVTISATFTLLGILTYSKILIRHLSNKVGWFGIVAGVLGIVGAWIGWIDASLQYFGFALFIPMLLWQFTFGFWLMRKGCPENNPGALNT